MDDELRQKLDLMMSGIERSSHQLTVVERNSSELRSDLTQLIQQNSNELRSDLTQLVVRSSHQLFLLIESVKESFEREISRLRERIDLMDTRLNKIAAGTHYVTRLVEWSEKT